MFSGFVLSNIDTVRLYERELFNSKKISWWVMQRLYFDMDKSIVNGEAGFLMTSMDQLYEHFVSRAQDKIFGDQFSEHGGPGNNEFSLDFMALGIIVYAIHEGMDIQYDSKFVPQGLLRHANSTA